MSATITTEAIAAAAATTIPEAIAAAARRAGPRYVIAEDATSGQLTYRRLLTGAAVLARELAPLADVGKSIGVMLPTAAGAAVTVLALMSAGRVPAMLNFTAGAANMLAACHVAGVSTVLTSRAFVAKARLETEVAALSAVVRVLYLEDIRAGIGIATKIAGALSAFRPLVRRQPDDPAAILFTSGSEGLPKAVVLSHRNMLANITQGAACLEFGPSDRLFDCLPVFHSFGLTIGLLLPLVVAVRVFLYPSPLHYKVIPELIHAWGATILLSTNTFLSGYGRAGGPNDFATLRLIVAGAEPLRSSTRRLYLEKFGARIHEGYGVTEASPAICFNTLAHNREGTVGRLLPGIQARLEPVPGVANGGRLLVHGPNVMLGYLDRDHQGELLRPPSGWHDTGDIVDIDADGYVTIRGRARRFAKIGGEMVSLAAVENIAADVWPDAAFAVTTLPDPRKGERLVLLIAQPGATREAFAARARTIGVSELTIPGDVIVVQELPLLGSGKVDHAGVARLAQSVAGIAAAG